MTDISRRSATLLALLAPFAKSALANAAPAAEPPKPPADHDMSKVPASWTRHDQIAKLIYPRMTALDLVGPQYMFASLMGAQVHLVGKTGSPVTSDTGITITPTCTFEDCPTDLTVLFTPGGTDGTLAAMEDTATRDFMADRGSRAQYVTSVCTGSLILGSAGLLKGYKATSHWAAREVLTDFGAIPTDARVVRDRNRITGAGVTAGLDFGLQMIAELRDSNYAQDVQLLCEYDPRPPFHAGSIHSAPTEVKSTMGGMLSGFTKKAHELARKLQLS
jgi:putative intracellular protease/amidase